MIEHDVEGALVSVDVSLHLVGNGRYLEHGFLVLHTDDHDDDSSWEVRGPGVWAGPGWVKVEGPRTSVMVDIDVTIGTGVDDVPAGAGFSASLGVVHESIHLGEPFGLRWDVPEGTYVVTAEITELSAGDDGEDLPVEAWRVRIIGG